MTLHSTSHNDIKEDCGPMCVDKKWTTGQCCWTPTQKPAKILDHMPSCKTYFSFFSLFGHRTIALHDMLEIPYHDIWLCYRTGSFRSALLYPFSSSATDAPADLAAWRKRSERHFQCHINRLPPLHIFPPTSTAVHLVQLQSSLAGRTETALAAALKTPFHTLFEEKIQ